MADDVKRALEAAAKHICRAACYLDCQCESPPPEHHRDAAAAAVERAAKEGE